MVACLMKPILWAFFMHRVKAVTERQTPVFSAITLKSTPGLLRTEKALGDKPASRDPTKD